jgi:prepilin-type N-terminal cleavage/methylation domain-containing protein
MQPATETKNCIAGYTLLEVMVALLIVAMSLGAVFQNLSQSKRSAIRSENALKAVRLAHNIFNDAAGISEVMRREIIEGDIPGEDDWHYRITSSPLVLDPLDPEKGSRPVEIEVVKKITLCVLHGPREQAQSFCFEKWLRP